MPLTLYQSNRLEVLAFHLADEMRQNPLPPLIPELIVMQSRGMARWLAMRVARHNGCWAHVTCPFPNAFIREIFSRIVNRQDLAVESRETLSWRLMHLLDEVSDKPGFEDIAAYIEESEYMRFQFAWQLADRFDQYTIFRPDLVLQWEDGRSDGWQSELWRVMTGRFDLLHRARLKSQCLEILSDRDFDKTLLPSRIALFGISYLPPYHLEILAALAAHIDVSFYLLNPCREYWSDIVSGKSIAKITGRDGLTAEELHLEKGNSLLASMGEHGRDFLSMIEEQDCLTHDLFVEPEAGTLLGALQADILNLRDTGESLVREIDADHDNSVKINSCHSPLRELEVLHDHLLDLFEHDPQLDPTDVLVMIPDIEAYTPLVHTVFSKPAGDPMRIPYAIADRTVRRESKTVEALRNILDLCGSRFELSSVLDTLEFPAVRQRFALQSEDLEFLEKWTMEVGIRWGMDENSRSTIGLPAFPEYSWRFGIDRLLLGYAMAGKEGRLFENILPYDQMEGGTTAVLGRFLDYLDVLASFLRTARDPHSLKEWAEIFVGLLAHCFAISEENEHEVLSLRKLFASLPDLHERSGFTGKVGFEVIRFFLDKLFEEERGGSAFMSGGVTFCAMLPLRSVPFKVICLLGMNDKDYPRPPRRLSFDLMTGKPQRGDRSTSKDDRYLFLETILSARQQLYISFVGHSLREDNQFPPSVLVSELVDYLEEAQGSYSSEGKIGVVHHKLQPFDPAYFRKNRELFSYSPENYQGAVAVAGPRIAALPFLQQPLGQPPEEFRQVSISQLCRFFSHPARYFCQARLGILFPEERELLENVENIRLNRLDRYCLEQEIVEKYLAGFEPEDLMEVFRAAAKLPPANVGGVEFASVKRRAVAFGKRILSLVPGRHPALDVDLLLGDFRISGQITDIRDRGLVFYRNAKVKAKDIIRLWLCHLIYNAAEPGWAEKQSYFAGTDCTIVLPPLDKDESVSLLHDIVGLYWQGLTFPLNIFPNASFAYAEMISNGKNKEDALAKAVSAWRGNDFMAGEGDDRYHVLCFRGIDPFDQEFADRATQFFLPFLHHRQRVGP